MSTQLAFEQSPSLPFDLSGAPRTPRRGRRPNNLEQLRKTRDAKTSSARRTGARTSSGEWRIDETTKQAGRAGIASARQALASARRDRFDEASQLPEAA